MRRVRAKKLIGDKISKNILSVRKTVRSKKKFLKSVNTVITSLRYKLN